MPPAPKSLMNETPAAGAAPAAAGGSPASPPPADDAAAAAAAAAGANRTASEGQRFEGQQSTQRPEFVPEKFWKDGKVDMETAFNSYKELETKFTTKTEELLKQLDADRRKGLPEAPEKYEIKLEADAPVTVDELTGHPAIDFWRKTAFEAGLPPEKFNEGVAQLVGILTAGPDLVAEKAALGENADARIAAVGQWATSKLADDPDAFKAVQLVGSTAAGVRALEKLMNANTPAASGNEPPPPPELTPEKLREMQSDPRYWDRNKRDLAFVKKVDDAFNALYTKKK